MGARRGRSVHAYRVVSRKRAVGPFYHGICPPPVGYSTFNQAVLGGLCVLGTRRGAETGPSPDWRRSHPGVFLQLSHASGRHSGRPVPRVRALFSVSPRAVVRVGQRDASRAFAQGSAAASVPAHPLSLALRAVVRVGPRDAGRAFAPSSAGVASRAFEPCSAVAPVPALSPLRAIVRVGLRDASRAFAPCSAVASVPSHSLFLPLAPSCALGCASRAAPMRAMLRGGVLFFLVFDSRA